MSWVATSNETRSARDYKNTYNVDVLWTQQRKILRNIFASLRPIKIFSNIVHQKKRVVSCELYLFIVKKKRKDGSSSRQRTLKMMMMMIFLFSLFFFFIFCLKTNREWVSEWEEEKTECKKEYEKWVC